MKHFVFLFFIYFFCGLFATAQVADTTATRTDSVSTLQVKDQPSALDRILAENIFLNTKATPVSLTVKPRKAPGTDVFFYLLAGLILLFGVAKAVYARYFSNLFRVFFNSSLRQSQLTDQLVQDQLPSLIFNTLFVTSVGLYCYFLMRYFNFINQETNWKLIWTCIAGAAIVYFTKYSVLKFTGWITGFKQEADIYTFIIFLINKIIGICLLPVIVVLAFSNKQIADIFVLLSFILIGLLMLMRFFRSYGLLQSRIRVSRFHFFLYIFSVEILPLFIIYKVILLFFGRSL